MQDVCENASFWENTIYKGEFKTQFYYSSDYDFAYCKVPKGGSTFWTQTFSAYDGKTLDKHWAPIFSLCRPCEVNRFVLVKQEYFAKDVEHVLHGVRVEQDKLDTIMKGLYDHRVDDTVPGIVATVMYKIGVQPNVIACLGWKEVVRRIWVSCQIQGYIQENIPFPIERINTTSQYENSTLLINIIMDTIAANPMTPAVSKKQRRNALVNAYETIRSETIHAIQEVYREDFELYNYDTTPPK